MNMSISCVINEQHSPSCAGISRFQRFTKITIRCDGIPNKPFLTFQAEYLFSLPESKYAKNNVAFTEYTPQASCLSFSPKEKDIINGIIKRNEIYVAIEQLNCGPALSYTLYVYNKELVEAKLIPFVRWTTCIDNNNCQCMLCDSDNYSGNSSENQEIFILLNIGIHPIVISCDASHPLIL
jgi:hypothetical protein